MDFPDFQDFLVDIDSMRDMHGGLGPRRCEITEIWEKYEDSRSTLNPLLNGLVDAGILVKVRVPPAGGARTCSVHYSTRNEVSNTKTRR